MIIIMIIWMIIIYYRLILVGLSFITLEFHPVSISTFAFLFIVRIPTVSVQFGMFKKCLDPICTMWFTWQWLVLMLTAVPLRPMDILIPKRWHFHQY